MKPRSTQLRTLQRQQIRSWREAAKLTQLEVASELAWSATQYWRLENGYTDPADLPQDTQKKLAGILKISVDDLLSLARVA